MAEPGAVLNLKSIIYVSSATKLFSAAAVRELLEKSRHNNAAAGLSGILLYWDGNFLQYVEGPADELDRLMAKIEDDPRHRGLIVLERADIAERAFPEWTMAFDMAKGNLDGQSDFLSDGILTAKAGTLAPAARRILEVFREQMR